MQFKYGHIYDGKEKAQIRRTPSGNVIITLGGRHVCSSTKKQIIKTALENYRTIELSDNAKLIDIEDITYLYTNNQFTIANINDVWKYTEDNNEELPEL